MSKRFEHLSLEDRLFGYIMLFTTISSLFIIVENIVIQFPFEANYIWIACMLLSLIGFLSTLYQKYNKPLQLLVFISVIFIILPLGWLSGGIYNYFPIAYTFIICIGVCYFFTGWIRAFFISALIGITWVMVSLVYYQPELFTHVTTRTTYLDSLMQTPFTLISAALMLSIFSNAFHQERKQLTQYSNLLDTQNAHLLKITSTDELTGIPNRRFVLHYLGELIKNPSTPFLVGMLDIDNFKSINDTYGHTVGDLIIQLVSQKLSLVAGTDAIVGRYGGDEFILIVPLSDHYLSILQKIKNLKIDDQAYPKKLSISAGFAKYYPTMTMDDILNAADQLLYDVKEAGKNDIKVQL